MQTGKLQLPECSCIIIKILTILYMDLLVSLYEPLFVFDKEM